MPEKENHDENPPPALSGASGTVKVLFPLPLSKPYDYTPPPGEVLSPGAFVRAPLGPRLIAGVVWAADDEKPPPTARLKAVAAVIDAPRLPKSVMAFVDWVAAYTMFPAGAVLRLVMRSGDALRPIRSITALRHTGASPERMTPAREKVLGVVDDTPQTARALAERAGVSDAVVRGLEKIGVFEKVALDPDPPFDAPDLSRSGKALTDAQQNAVAQARLLMSNPQPAPLLIDGVTGSGKTEVYLEAAAAALEADATAQVLILLPEIALTLPFLDRVADRFGAAPAAWHSDVKSAERRRVWRRVLEGDARIVVGARSALFLPYQNLKMIIVDEEHESAYKQEDGVIYHGRDMAVARGALDGFPVLLASATPSLETVVNVDQGRYELTRLEDRYGGAHMPNVSLIDLRQDAPEKGAWLSPKLVDEVNQTIAHHQQALLFLNRRGYAPLTICRKCGHRMKAPNSDTWLVEHRFENRLVCHHSGFSMPKPSACPQCHTVGGLTACGPGVERVAEEARQRWPDAAIEVLSSDTYASPSAMRAALDRMRAGVIDVLVATQVVAKGHHFPNLSLVGVVDADMGLAGGDLRAAERTYQLLSQVAGRAGREATRGRAVLQTHQPSAPVMQALANGDRDAFLAAEAASRETQGFPPYGRLAAVLLRSSDEGKLRAAAEAHRAAAPRADGVEVWGPAPAPLYRLRGEARMRFLVKARRHVHMQRFMEAWLSGVKLRGPVRRSVDIDPYTFL